jgi:outer membrane protein OmpA-like peptidoglycan-associated protein
MAVAHWCAEHCPSDDGCLMSGGMSCRAVAMALHEGSPSAEVDTSVAEEHPPETTPAPRDSDSRVAESAPALGDRVVLVHSDPLITPRLHFSLATSHLRPRDDALLDATAAMLMDARWAAGRVLLGGHASSDEEDARRLGRLRAEGVRDALVRRGIDAARLEVRTFGAARPVDPRPNEEARAVNRRVEVTLIEGE